MDRPIVVVLDPGHGGLAAADGSAANNAVGPNGLMEKDLALLVARAAERLLTAAQQQVILTRADDTNIPLADRAARARDSGAAAFVSLHFNGQADPAVDGTEVYVSDRANESDRALAQGLLSAVGPATGVPDRGVRTAPFAVLSPDSRAPGEAACLVELAFLSNPQQAERLASRPYVEQLGTAVAQGILSYAARIASTNGQAPYAAQSRTYTLSVVGGGRAELDCPLLAPHGSARPNLILKWNVAPANYPKVDVVVHFHGYGAQNLSLRAKEQISGLDLFARGAGPDDDPTRSRPTLAILPRGQLGGPCTSCGPGVFVYTFPALTGSATALDALIRYSLDALATQQLQQDAGTIETDRLILTAHSGGGAALQAELTLGSDPSELHVFDALYRAPGPLIAWAQRHIQQDAATLAGQDRATWDDCMRTQGGALRVLYTSKGGTAANSKTLADAVYCALQAVTDSDTRDFLSRWYRVELADVPHNDVPPTFGGQLLADASADLVGGAHNPPTAPPAPASCPTPATQSLGYRALDDADPSGTRPDADANNAWIFDLTESAIGRIPDAAKRAHFLNEVDWTQTLYPDPRAAGSDRQKMAEPAALFAAMAALVPERRVPRLVPWAEIDDLVSTVPGTRQKLFPTAADAFVQLRDAAAATQDAAGNGITLTIGSAWRSSGQQAANAARNTNRNAVAGQRSAHRYGLAVDLYLTYGDLHVHEICATDRSCAPGMVNLIRMYRSPIYKWMMLHGADYGWYPYAYEPWHWEYDPPGFPEQFLQTVQNLRASRASALV